VVVLNANEVGPELQKLIDLSYVDCDPALPTDPAFVAMVNSKLDSDPGSPYIAQTTAPAIDELVADGQSYDYIHGLNSLHVGITGRAERMVGGAGVEKLLAPFGKTSSMDVKYIVVDDNTIRLKNDTGGGSGVRFRVQAFLMG